MLIILDVVSVDQSHCQNRNSQSQHQRGLLLRGALDDGEYSGLELSEEVVAGLESRDIELRESLVNEQQHGVKTVPEGLLILNEKFEDIAKDKQRKVGVRVGIVELEVRDLNKESAYGAGGVED